VDTDADQLPAKRVRWRGNPVLLLEDAPFELYDMDEDEVDGAD